jgi:hypothetical protein
MLPLKLGLCLNDCILAELTRKPLENIETEFRMRHLAAAEHDRDLDLGVGRQEAQDVLLLGLVVVNVDLGTELDLLDFDLGLVLARELFLLGLLVLELPVVHNPAHGRVGKRRNLNQVEILLLGDSLGVRHRKDAQLAPINADKSALLGAYALVDPWFRAAADRQLTSVVSKGLCSCRPSYKNKSPAGHVATDGRDRHPRNRPFAGHFRRHSHRPDSRHIGAARWEPIHPNVQGGSRL